MKPSHFIENDTEHSLLARLRKTLPNAQYFDVLTGFFRLSGFHLLQESLASVDKVRILVGMGADPETQRAAFISRNPELDFTSSHEAKASYRQGVKQELANAPDEEEVEKGIKGLLAMLRQPLEAAAEAEDRAAGGNGCKLEMRVFPSRDLHAKVYIHRYRQGANMGAVITGSSNVSRNGLQEQLEFNVELRDDSDVAYALNRFEALWQKSVPINDELTETIEQQTWLREDITPYELFLKMLLEYFGDRVYDDDLEEDYFIPEGFLRLRYQLDAAKQARIILNKYHGLFLSDVVGLGKTYITALTLQGLKGRKLIVCPPVLVDGWKEALDRYNVSATVVSSGKLGSVAAKGSEKWQIIVVDESHRFRNEGTEMYSHLATLCTSPPNTPDDLRKKVILLSATPLNNRLSDLSAQLKLFQPPRASNIPGLRNYESFFNDLRKHIEEDRAEMLAAKAALEAVAPAGFLRSVVSPPDLPPHLAELLARFCEAEAKLKATIQRNSHIVRDSILKYLMVRRTRTDIQNHFTEDIEEQGIAFPKVDVPKRIIYEFQGPAEKAFRDTIKLLELYEYARYTPKKFLKTDVPDFQQIAERNLGTFMKGLLVKRLESSLFAFQKSIGRFIHSLERFIGMYEKGTVYIGKDQLLADLVENEDYEKLDALEEEGKLEKFASADFKPGFKKALQQDLSILTAIAKLWEDIEDDPKLNAFLQAVKLNKGLQKGKVILFTESKETAEYLFTQLNASYPGGVMYFHAGGGRIGSPSRHLGKEEGRDLILENFDPGMDSHRQSDELLFLITTDVLAEGINLHRGNHIVNYDLPWNPTRVLQRVGRVNRIGSQHKSIHIFNFFPTTHSDRHLNQEQNITQKIQMFQSILGEDARILSDSEEIGSYELFKRLEDPDTYSQDTEEESELKYLELIRKVRANDLPTFERIISIPPKARCAKHQPNGVPGLVSFFRQGALRRFIFSSTNVTEEIDFFRAAELMSSTSEEKPVPVPTQLFYSGLKLNKDKFEELSHENTQQQTQSRVGGNLAQTIGSIRSIYQRHKEKLASEDIQFVEQALEWLGQGSAPARFANDLHKSFVKKLTPELLVDPKAFTKAMRTILKNVQLVGKQKNDTIDSTPLEYGEVILSMMGLKST